LAGEGETARTFVVSVHEHPGETAGVLEIRSPSSAPTTREVSGRTCREVSNALALICALAIDPDSAVAPPPGPAPPATVPTTPPPPPRPPPAETAPGSSVGLPSRPWHGAIGMLGGVRGFVLPVAAVTVTLFGALEVPDAESGLLSSFRLSAQAARTGWVSR